MEINREYLVNALREVSPALGSNNLIPVFQSYVFANNMLMASDGSLTIKKQLDLDTGLNCCVRGAPFIKLLDSLKQETITIERDGDSLFIDTQEVVGNFLLSADDTVMEKFKCEHNMIMAPIIISLNSCLYATSDDETQDVLCGVHIDEKYLFATDRFRIVRVPVDIPEAGKDLIGLRNIDRNANNPKSISCK